MTMNITIEQLQAEAGLMALELRFKDQAIATLQAEVAQLREQTAAAAADDAGPG